MMPVDRSHLKTAMAAILDALAQEHPLGHQDTYARRYILTTRSGMPLELMFEQSPKTPANLWIERRLAGALTTSGIKQRQSLASSLYSVIGKNGDPQYGRHSALEKMPNLGNVDLICLQSETLAEVGRILDQLLAV
ncbi:hypothetical protein [Rhizobium oryzicola]|uniref:Uncharacterized protein n=1 Tax=Rhizobium oryzicola TaxID=1232668 RepID=A0ABT8SRB4_9HYPH|nr:hypothetical protein [Rhizobium oryzicola]MDO1580963.1 hypothetical protein [Rhizobium oryzicola]